MLPLDKYNWAVLEEKDKQGRRMSFDEYYRLVSDRVKQADVSQGKIAKGAVLASLRGKGNLSGEV